MSKLATDRLPLLSPGGKPGTRTALALSAVGAVVMLLMNLPGWAIVCAAAALPLSFLFEGGQRLRVAGAGRMAWLLWIWGYAAGVVTASVCALIVSLLWVDELGFHPGAAGFGGSAVQQAGLPGIALLVIVPAFNAAGVVLAAVGTVWLARSAHFTKDPDNATWSGLIVGAAVAEAGVLVALWPILMGNGGYGGEVADWTSLLLGFIVTRPVIFAVLTAMVVQGISSEGRRRGLAGIGVLLLLLFVLGDLVTQSRGSRLELAWHALTIAVCVPIFWRVRTSGQGGRGVAPDQPGLTEPVHCSACGRIIPDGAFCSYCGARVAEPLVSPTESTAATVHPTANQDEQNGGRS